MTISPCFVMCGNAACKTLGCVRVYNEREQEREWQEIEAEMAHMRARADQRQVRLSVSLP